MYPIRIVPSEFTPGAYWIECPYPGSFSGKLSKSAQEFGRWDPISSWPSLEAAKKAQEFYV